jgi:hypothetical protein
MHKPAGLKGQTKHDAIAEDRHNPTMPPNDPLLWARGLTTTRVADLFRTLPGLPGHWLQLQGAVNAGNNFFYTTTNFGGGLNDGGRTSEQGKHLINWIALAVIAAAKAATFDFPMQQLQFTKDTGWLKLSRVNGKVIVHSSPVKVAE